MTRIYECELLGYDTEKSGWGYQGFEEHIASIFRIDDYTVIT
jgi:hypothetical protein